MDEQTVLLADFQGNLPHGFNKGLGLNITDGTANFGDDNISTCLSAHLIHKFLDFVCDMRAPTPSAAAEIAVPDSKELMMRIDSYEERLTLSLKRSVEVLRNKLADREKFIKSTAPLSYLEGKRNTLALYTEKSVNAVSHKLTQLRSSLAVNAKKADALSPLSVISRGYSLAENDGCVVRSIKQVENGDLLLVRVSDGVIESVVTNCNEKEYKDGEN